MFSMIYEAVIISTCIGSDRLLCQMQYMYDHHYFDKIMQACVLVPFVADY